MSTFSGLNTAWTGLTAARRAMETAGQNMANVGTEGYTRQRVETAAAGAPAAVGRLGGTPQPGQGVVLLDVARLSNPQLDARVRDTAALSSQTQSITAGLSAIEDIFREPGPDGLSALLAEFWSGWEDIASAPGDEAPAAVLLSQGQALADRLAQMHQELSSQYLSQHQKLAEQVNEVNATALALADLNRQVSTAAAAGSSVNELLDQRDRMTERLAELTGAEVRNQPDGSAEVFIGGTPLVTGGTARALQLNGSAVLGQGGVQLSWSHRPEGGAATIQGGAIASSLTMLATADDAGSGGPIAQTAAALDDLATALADQVNAVHREGRTVAGEPGGDFFTLDPDRPAASLAVAISGARELATGDPGHGNLDGSNALKIAELAASPGGPDALWTALVTSTGTAVRNAAQASVNASVSYVSSVEQQRSHSAVSLDEENISLLTHQYAYQGAARVMTAIDQMLDVLINRTGVVGR